MKISEIIAREPIKVITGRDIAHIDWGDIFRFDTTLAYGWPSKQAEAELAELDLELRTYWADNSQHMELNCLFYFGTPVVLYETTDSWDSHGEAWPLDEELYMMLYDIIKPATEVTLYDIDTDIESDYIGIETPAAGWYCS